MLITVFDFDIFFYIKIVKDEDYYENCVLSMVDVNDVL